MRASPAQTLVCFISWDAAAARKEPLGRGARIPMMRQVLPCEMDHTTHGRSKRQRRTDSVARVPTESGIRLHDTMQHYPRETAWHHGHGEGSLQLCRFQQ